MQMNSSKHTYVREMSKVVKLKLFEVKSCNEAETENIRRGSAVECLNLSQTRTEACTWA